MIKVREYLQKMWNEFIDFHTSFWWWIAKVSIVSWILIRLWLTLPFEISNKIEECINYIPQWVRYIIFILWVIYIWYTVWLKEHINYNKLKQEFEDYKNKENDLSKEGRKLLFELYDSYLECWCWSDINTCGAYCKLEWNDIIYIKELFDYWYLDKKYLNEWNDWDEFRVSWITYRWLEYLKTHKTQLSL